MTISFAVGTASLVGILALSIYNNIKKSTSSDEKNKTASNAECEKWKQTKKEYEDCVAAGGGAIPCSYAYYGNNGGPPPPPSGCGCNKGK